MELVNHWAEIVLRNLVWTGGWVVAAVLLFLLCVAVMGTGSRDQGSGISQRRGAQKKAVAECARCRRRDEMNRDRPSREERIRQLEKFLATASVEAPEQDHEPRRSRRVGPPNPRAGGEPATGRRIDRVA